jgi:superfamily II DNA or RNA helicase
MDKEYKNFLQSKELIDHDSGFDIDKSELNPMLFDFQKAIVKWSLRRGRSAVFADTGLGKTILQLDWANHVYKKMNKSILIFAPLTVSKQTRVEGHKFGSKVNICRKQSDIIDGINITNYEMLKHFKPDNLGGLVLDESGILKGLDGKFRRAITDFGETIPYRLCCTATPSPNDLVEIINHAEFLGIMKEKEIKALFFINRGQETGIQVQKWGLKRHAENDFWKWLASWSVALRKPSDLGSEFEHEDKIFILPKLNTIQKVLPPLKEDILPGQLLEIESQTLKDRQISRRKTTKRRSKFCAGLVNNSNEQWIVWCDLNYESNMLKKMIPDSVEVKGADSQEHKEKSMFDFQNGKIRVLISKPSIFGFGLNLQNCHNMCFVGLSDSFEKLYQATRRCWRFGQKHEVNSYIITTKVEGAVVRNIQRKEREAKKLFDNVIRNMNLSGQLKTRREEMVYNDNKKIVLPDFLLD